MPSNSHSTFDFGFDFGFDFDFSGFWCYEKKRNTKKHRFFVLSKYANGPSYVTVFSFWKKFFQKEKAVLHIMFSNE